MMKSPAVWIKIIIFIAGMYVLSQVTVIYLPLIIAVIAAFVLNPFVDSLAAAAIGRHQYHIPRSLAILLVFTLAALLLLLLTTSVLLPVVSEFNKFVVDLPRLATKIKSLTLLLAEQAKTVQIPDNIRLLIEDGMSGSAAYGISLVRNGINAVFSFATQVIELVVVPVLAYYFLKDWRSLKTAVITLFPRSAQVRLTNVIDELAAVVSNYIRGQILISGLMGFLVFVGMYFLKVDYPIVLGLLAALTETIPIIGPIIGAIPAILLAYLASPLLAVKVAAFYIILHQVENHIIVPNIMGHTIDLHPIMVIISLLIGGQLYGIAGMILAVPVAALLKVILRHLWYIDEVK